jgi:hypothetical protein
VRYLLHVALESKKIENIEWLESSGNYVNLHI